MGSFGKRSSGRPKYSELYARQSAPRQNNVKNVRSLLQERKGQLEHPKGTSSNSNDLSPTVKAVVKLPELTDNTWNRNLTCL